MFDTLLKLLDFLDKILPAISKWRQDRSLAQIGVKLHGVYVALNETIITGRLIVEGMEGYVKKAGRYYEGVVPWTYTIDMGQHLRQVAAGHAYNLRRAADALQSLTKEFQVLDPNTYRKIMLLMARKAGNIRDLFAQFSDIQLPLRGITPEDMEKLDQSVSPQDFDQRIQIQKAEPLLQSDFMFTSMLPSKAGEELYRIVKLIEASVLRLDVPWDREVYPIINDYLDKAQPGKQLDSLERILRNLRKALEENFELKDVLATMTAQQARTK